MGFDIEASHHEVAPGQHEIDFNMQMLLQHVIISKHLNWLLKQSHVNIIYTQHLCLNHYSV